MNMKLGSIAGLKPDIQYPDIFIFQNFFVQWFFANLYLGIQKC